MIMELFKTRSGPNNASLIGIFVAPAAGQPMRAVQSVHAVAGSGLQGDRYGEHAGFWKATDACQVTLITEYELNRARTHDLDLKSKLANGQHRRNLVIRGLTPKQLAGRRFKIGTAAFVCIKPRPPCGYLDQVEGEGLCRALGRNSGLCIGVIDSGMVSVGDAVELLDDNL